MMYSNLCLSFRETVPLSRLEISAHCWLAEAVLGCQGPAMLGGPVQVDPMAAVWPPAQLAPAPPFGCTT